ncbi:ChaN family lipoprotein [Chishuiella sp.]|uniref:ChaN family lipoprotein n=1 Tax=Chishuiella sp. TaxID=1969467 RepID=UPI0028B05EB9|nr:ChaN family lipoprotein [Chishuiella sp.]
MKKVILAFIFATISTVNAQDLKNYQIYNQKENKVTFDKMIKELSSYDIVLFGEHHNDAINHWLQLQATKELYKLKDGKVILGAEMFERHQQKDLTDYLQNKIEDKDLQTKTVLWKNYPTDYKPLVDFAKEKKIPFVATNVTRKFASYISKNGLSSLDTISNDDKKNIVKLPFDIDYNAPGYPEMIKMMGEHAGFRAKQFVAAQAVKDATMAESILSNYKTGELFIHFNGDYHSKNYGGIYWYLKHKNFNLKIAVIEILEASDSKLNVEKPKDENFTATEFIIVLPKDSPKSY